MVSLSFLHTKTEPEWSTSLVALRKQPSSSTIDHLVKSPGFESQFSDLFLPGDSTEASMTIAYFKDVTYMNAMVLTIGE